MDLDSDLYYPNANYGPAAHLIGGVMLLGCAFGALCALCELGRHLRGRWRGTAKPVPLGLCLIIAIPTATPWAAIIYAALT